MRQRLSVKLLMLFIVLHVLYSVLIWWGVLAYSPRIYSHSAAEMQEHMDAPAACLDVDDPVDLRYYLQEYADTIRVCSEDEFVLRIFGQDGQELSIPNLLPLTTQISDYENVEHTKPVASPRGRAERTISPLPRRTLNFQVRSSLRFASRFLCCPPWGRAPRHASRF